MLDLWPLTNVRKLAKQLRMQPSQLMRRVGWTKNKRRYYLELKQPLPELEAGTYMTPSLAMCMVPATIASAVAEERGVRTRLVNPDPPPLAPTAASAAGSTPVIAVLAHVEGMMREDSAFREMLVRTTRFRRRAYLLLS